MTNEEIIDSLLKDYDSITLDSLEYQFFNLFGIISHYYELGGNLGYERKLDGCLYFFSDNIKNIEDLKNYIEKSLKDNKDYIYELVKNNKVIINPNILY